MSTNFYFTTPVSNSKFSQVTNRDMSIAVLRHFLPILASEKQQGMYKPPKGARQKLREREQGGGRAPATADGGESSAAAAVGEGAAAAAGEGTAVVEAGAGSKAQGGEGAEASGSGDAKAGPSGVQARPPGKVRGVGVLGVMYKGQDNGLVGWGRKGNAG